MKRNVKEVVLQHDGFKFNVTLYERSLIGLIWTRCLKIVCLNPPEGSTGLIYKGTYALDSTWWDRMGEAKSEIIMWCRYAQNLRNEEEAFKEAQRSGGVF